ncbi:MAG TPA: hypothetical protein VK866_17735, partial [Acidimicrobiales bacterium]|nr:hypothetical protein [Acidimicrobiales bacterium]
DAARPPGTVPLGRAAVNPERESESRELPLVTSMRQVVRAEIGAVHHDLETSLARRRREEVLALVAVSALTVAVSTAVLVLAAPTLGRSS